MIKVIELGDEKFTIVSVVLTLFEHQGIKARSPSCGDGVVPPLSDAGCRLLTCFHHDLTLRGNKALAFKLADQRIEDAPTNLAKWPKEADENFAQLIAVRGSIHQFSKYEQFIDEMLMPTTPLFFVLIVNRFICLVCSTRFRCHALPPISF